MGVHCVALQEDTVEVLLIIQKIDLVEHLLSEDTTFHSGKSKGLGFGLPARRFLVKGYEGTLTILLHLHHHGGCFRFVCLCCIHLALRFLHLVC